MAAGEGFIDPFGAPEIYNDGVAYREWAGGGLIRSAFYAYENGERIIRVKLLTPAAICSAERQALHNFLATGGPAGSSLRLVTK